MILKHKFSGDFDGLQEKRLVFEVGGGTETSSEDVPRAPEDEEGWEDARTIEDASPQAQRLAAEIIARQEAALGGRSGRMPDVKGPTAEDTPDLSFGAANEGRTVRGGSQRQFESYVDLSPEEQQAHNEMMVKVRERRAERAEETSSESPDDAYARVMSRKQDLVTFMKEAGADWKANNQAFAEKFNIQGDIIPVIRKLQERIGLKGDDVDGKWGRKTSARLASNLQLMREIEEAGRTQIAGIQGIEPFTEA